MRGLEDGSVPSLTAALEFFGSQKIMDRFRGVIVIAIAQSVIYSNLTLRNSFSPAWAPHASPVELAVHSCGAEQLGAVGAASARS